MVGAGLRSIVMPESIHEQTLQASLGRIAFLMCRDRNSSYYGCIDRDFWSYRTIRGFPASPYQNVMSGLAYLSEVSPFADLGRYRDNAIEVIRFWTQSLNRHGSANEWYRNEQSYCATALGLHSACEALFTLREVSSIFLNGSLVEKLRKSAEWLRNRENLLAANQRIASCASRYVLGVLLDEKPLEHDAKKLLKSIQSDFLRDGYLSEYGGMDIGYSLLSLDLLVSAHRAGLYECEPLVNGVSRQLTQVVSQYGELPYELGSRGTSHKFSAGVGYFADFTEQARILSDLTLASLRKQQSDELLAYDDRFFCSFAFSAFMRSLVVSLAKKETIRRFSVSELPTFGNHFKVNEPTISRVTCLGGTLFANNDLGQGLVWLGPASQRIVHLGYVFTDEETRRWTSLAHREKLSDQIVFTRASDRSPLVKFEVAVRVLFMICRISIVARLVSWVARTHLGRPRTKRGICLTRTVEVSTSQLVVHDLIHLSGKLSGTLRTLDTFPYHSPSMTPFQSVNSKELLFERRIEQKSGEQSVLFKWSIVRLSNGEIGVTSS